MTSLPDPDLGQIKAYKALKLKTFIQGKKEIENSKVCAVM